ncbi:MAG: ribonuclease H-like domain-containing protein [Synergistes sp.]|nr:ribonuclease H-like domain-containing protein [Synergistes sp.]
MRPNRKNPEKFGSLYGFLPDAKDKIKPVSDDLPKELDIDGLPDGEWAARGVYRMEKIFEYGRYYGKRKLTSPRESGDKLFCWGGSEECVFLDTETTGLSGGTGTYAFLVGIGLCKENALHVVQLFLAGPAWERNWLAALEAELPDGCSLVTYNGKRFDLPLLRTRYTLSRAVPSWNNAPHLDLLMLARRFYRHRLASCSLSSMEQNVLGLKRSGEDIPGSEIPWLYTKFLSTQDASSLRGVFYHNTLDIVSLAALQLHIAEMAEGTCLCAEDYICAGDMWASKGFCERAAAAWKEALAFGDSRCDALLRLAEQARRSCRHAEAHAYLIQALNDTHNLSVKIALLTAIAKAEEHTLHDLSSALAHAKEALICHERRKIFSDAKWREEKNSILHRIDRIERKMRKQTET